MNADIEIMTNRVRGLEEHLRGLRGDLALLQKAKGLDEAAEVQRQHAEACAAQKQELKRALEDLKRKKDQAVAGSCAKLAESMAAILPDGEAVFRVDDDGKVALAWNRDGREAPHAGLSGGEKVLFEAALANALLSRSEHRALVVEAAELDQERLAMALAHIAAVNPGTQLIVNTCHRPDVVPDGWDVVEMGGDHGNA